MIAAGLCRMCRYGRNVSSSRGSHFLLCERSRTDERFPRYPSLPVRRCSGFEANGDSGREGNES
jgi:hypothetical protein